MTDFCTHSYTSTREISTILHIFSLIKDPLWSGPSPYRALEEASPTAPSSPPGRFTPPLSKELKSHQFKDVIRRIFACKVDNTRQYKTYKSLGWHPPLKSVWANYIHTPVAQASQMSTCLSERKCSGLASLVRLFNSHESFSYDVVSALTGEFSFTAHITLVKGFYGELFKGESL